VGAPAEAIRELTRALADAPINARARYVRNDIADLRLAFPIDDDFAQAIRSVANRLRILRASDGSELLHGLRGWRRIKFSSGLYPNADLRIIFRPDGSQSRILVFGHRHEPNSIYSRANARDL
jgi:hypothetical protein